MCILRLLLETTGLGLGLVAMGLSLGLGLECVDLGLVLGLEALSLESKSALLEHLIPYFKTYR